MSSPFAFEWVAQHARVRPSAPAIATPSHRLTYAELHDRVRALAAALVDFGLAPGERVLIALPNLPACVVASLAVQAAGGCAVELNRDLGSEGIAVIARQTGAKLAVAYGRDAVLWRKVTGASGLSRLLAVHSGELPARMREALGPLPVQRLSEEGVLDQAAPHFEPRPADPEAPALLVFTSGSTGEPRGVIQTARNLHANARSIVAYLGLTAEDRAMAILPLYYCYGKSVLTTHLLVGGSVFFDDRFMYPRTVLEAIGTEGCTGFAGVPLTFELLRRQVDPTQLRMPRLRYLTQAGGAMAPQTVAWTRSAFRPAELFVMYGQTEATARLSYLPPKDGERKAGSIGIAVPGVELKVVDEQGQKVGVEEVGHLVARGENVTPGYFQAPEETAAILRDGWLWTGDLARQDADGYLFLVGRAKELLKVGGHRVTPTEIEIRLSQHPAVAEAAVVGVPDPVDGEAAAAFIVLREGAQATAAELRKFCREALPAYKTPKQVRFADSLPRTGSGKIARPVLAALAREPEEA